MKPGDESLELSVACVHVTVLQCFEAGFENQSGFS